MTPKEISERLGGDAHAGYFLAPCPICQPEGRRDQRGLSIGQGDDRLLLHCHKSNCGFTDLLAALGISGDRVEVDRAELERARAERIAQAKAKLDKAQAKWRAALPIHGTPGERYLRGRGITCDLPQTLRWLPGEFHPHTGGPADAMVALIEPTGAIHRTFFDQQGKRLTNGAKLMLGPCRGGAVRLSQGAGPLVVCEGIETGLSLLSGLLSGPASVWAALSTSGMKSIDLPSATGALIVAVDGDAPGRAAGFDLMQRAAGLGWRVCHLTPPNGQDWNDVLMGKVPA